MVLEPHDHLHINHESLSWLVMAGPARVRWTLRTLPTWLIMASSLPGTVERLGFASELADRPARSQRLLGLGVYQAPIWPLCLLSVLPRDARLSRSPGGVIMGTWFWLNIPLALLFVCCWAGIPLWLTLTRWKAETDAKHAVIAAKAAPGPVLPEPVPAPAATHQTASPAYAK